MNTGVMTKERGANAECGKNYEIPDQRFDTKVKRQTGRASFWVNGSNYIPLSTEENSSEIPRRGVPGGMDGFGIDRCIIFIQNNSQFKNKLKHNTLISIDE